MHIIRDSAGPIAMVFADDGLVPNNRLPLIIYKNAINVDQEQPEDAIERVFGSNDWDQTWRGGIFDYLHYHATVHEALGVARGAARVQFGGDNGRALDLVAGDVAILPAGTGHQCLDASEGFVVVGAYPPGPSMQVTRATPENYRAALSAIPKVATPSNDPVFGQNGPLTLLWSDRTSC